MLDTDIDLINMRQKDIVHKKTTFPFQAEALDIKFAHVIKLETSEVMGVLKLALVTLQYKQTNKQTN